MHHRAKLRMRRRGIEAANVSGWTRPHDSEQRGDRIDDAGDAAERERGGAEAGDFPIRRIRVRPHEMHRIGGGFLAVVIVIERIETNRKFKGGSSRRHVVGH